MHCIRNTLQRNTLLRQFHKCVLHKQATEAVASEIPEKLTIPVPEGVPKPVSPKIDHIAQQITSLNLIEVAELSDLLKTRLNLPDAPVMPIAQIAKVEEEVVPKVVQTLFTVKLTKYDENKKVALIKEIKNTMTGLNLVQAKKFIESVPQVIKSELSKEEAEALKASLVKVGAEITIE